MMQNKVPRNGLSHRPRRARANSRPTDGATIIIPRQPEKVNRDFLLHEQRREATLALMDVLQSTVNVTRQMRGVLEHLNANVAALAA